MKIEKQQTEPSSIAIDCAVDLARLADMEAVADKLVAQSFGGPDTNGWKMARDLGDSIRALKTMVSAIQKDEMRRLLNVKPREVAVVPACDANGLACGARLIIEMSGIAPTRQERPDTISGIMAPALAVALDSLLSDPSHYNELAVCKAVADALRAAAKHKKA